MEKLEKAFALFDQYNQQDPNQLEWDGKTYAEEYFFALKLNEWVIQLQPEASEELLLASRSQHIGRWKIARSAYPMDRIGNLTWRSDLAKFHAKTAGELMLEAGYDQALIERAQKIIQKKQLKLDPEVQTIENALCLVFLQYQLDDFMKKHDEEKLIRILQKSWSKMDQAGRDAALTLAYSPDATALLGKALS